eukprot:2682298-Amphidinium_carterae.1
MVLERIPLKGSDKATHEAVCQRHSLHRVKQEGAILWLQICSKSQHYFNMHFCAIVPMQCNR